MASPVLTEHWLVTNRQTDKRQLYRPTVCCVVKTQHCNSNGSTSPHCSRALSFNHIHQVVAVWIPSYTWLLVSTRVFCQLTLVNTCFILCKQQFSLTWLFPDIPLTIHWQKANFLTFPDNCKILWHLQVFQKSGHPVKCGFLKKTSKSSLMWFFHRAVQLLELPTADSDTDPRQRNVF